jgi:CHAD domain-containing protein
MILPREWIEHLGAHAELARSGEDPEGVHQVRVAAGRLSVWLELGRRHVLRDDLRWVRRIAGPVRDIDVMLARDARDGYHEAAEWRAALRAERRAARETLLAALASARFRSLLAALAWSPGLGDERARATLPKFERRVARASAALERSPEDPVALHRLRRGLRRMRYALEWLGKDASALKKFQEDLGELNDLAVMLRREHRVPSASECAGQPAHMNGDAGASELLQQEIEVRRNRFLSDWRAAGLVRGSSADRASRSEAGAPARRRR